MSKNGLFVGLITLDFVYQVLLYPQQNQKMVATDYLITTGGPATNAAFTFQSFDSNLKTTLLTVLGNHPMSQLIRTELKQQAIHLIDLDPTRIESPPVSSIIITEATGDRAIVSINATRTQIQPNVIGDHILAEIDIVLIDGHQMLVGTEIAKQAQQKGIPVVMDGGSWKAETEGLLPFVDYAICSANFYPPDCQTPEAVFDYLSIFNIPNIAITQGKDPILYRSKNVEGTIEIPAIDAVDTLGAGDIFHGAFCYAILQKNWIEALKFAADIASQSCQQLGTRLSTH
ncbi:MAG: sugar kinase [Microcoleaceae cyanobacterium]